MSLHTANHSTVNYSTVSQPLEDRSSVAYPDNVSTGGPHFNIASATRDSTTDQSLGQGASYEHDEEQQILITALMPCLNEARTLAACIQQAHAGCQAALASRNVSLCFASGGGEESFDAQPNGAQASSSKLTYEILIADNGSTDGSPAIAEANGARVVHVEVKGHGSALQGGIAAARGKYIVMADSDCSYDFGEVPRFIDKLEEGYDLVMGNRFAGGIMPGAMPWHHRYIGNPVLSGIGRMLYRTPCRDWHCGLRAFDREKIRSINLISQGMEFASEMVIRGAQNRFQISEVPVTLSPDGRTRPPHLRSVRDGLRHLSLLIRAFLKAKGGGEPQLGMSSVSNK